MKNIKKITITFRRQFDPKKTKTIGQTFTKPSLTIPDMSIGVKQLLLNHTRGINNAVHHNEGIYSEQEIPIFDDITDKIAYLEDLKQQQLELEQVIKTEKTEKAAKAKKIRDEKLAKQKEEQPKPLKTDNNNPPL